MSDYDDSKGTTEATRRMASEHNLLAGYPSKGLIRKVRARLGRYGVKPGIVVPPMRELWFATWEWAAAQRKYPDWACKRPRRWPHENEIAAQYLTLMLAQLMRDDALRLPFGCSEHAPPILKRLLRERAEFGYNRPSGLLQLADDERQLARITADVAGEIAAKKLSALSAPKHKEGWHTIELPKRFATEASR